MVSPDYHTGRPKADVRPTPGSHQQVMLPRSNQWKRGPPCIGVQINVAILQFRASRAGP